MRCHDVRILPSKDVVLTVHYVYEDSISEFCCTSSSIFYILSIFIFEKLGGKELKAT